MSYSRYIDSSWYTYPSDDGGFIQCFGPGFIDLRWKPDVSLEEFIAEARANPEAASAVDELKSILEKNMEDIQRWMEKWRKQVS